MKKIRIAYIFTVFLFIISSGMVAWITSPFFISVPKNFLSPLPGFLTRTANAQVETLDLWNPVNQISQNQTFPLPDITAQSALSYDLVTNKLLYARNPQQKLPMASLTKIMTAIIASEHKKNDDRYTVPPQAIVGEDSMGLDAGEVLSFRELLYGLFLKSGNDAAEVYAANFPGGRDAFINAMNEKAQALGLTNTHYTNPTGLAGDGYQHTTAYDLLVVTRFALSNFPLIDEVGATAEEILPQTSTHKEYDLENETNLLTTYPGVVGLKTGYTPEAGLCLVTVLKYQGHDIIGIVLGSENRRDDMKQILDYSLEELGITPPPHE